MGGPVIKDAIYEKLDALVHELTRPVRYEDGAIQGLLHDASRAIEVHNKTRIVLSLGGGGSIPAQVSFPNIFFNDEFMSGLERGASVVIIAIDETFEHEHIRTSFKGKVSKMFVEERPPPANVPYVSRIISGFYGFIHICFVPIRIPSCVDTKEIAKTTYSLQRAGATLKYFMNNPPCEMGSEHKVENTHWVNVFTALVQKIKDFKVYVHNDAWWDTGLPFGIHHEHLDISVGRIIQFGINFEQLGIIPFIFGKYFTNYTNLFIIRIRDHEPIILPFFGEDVIIKYFRTNFSRPENAAYLGLMGGRSCRRRTRRRRRRRSSRLGRGRRT